MKSSKPKRKVSQREIWLVSLLPAALVVILSLALPGPAREAASIEARLARITGGNAEAETHRELRDLAKQLEEKQQALAALETEEAAAQARIQSLQKTPAAVRSRFNLAEGLDEFTRRLAVHGVRVLAMDEEAGSSQDQSKTDPRDWKISVAASWSGIHAALADAGTFPPGLALSAMNMQKPRPNASLQRWELVVTSPGATP